jgi:outer membrane protein assembly factor BamB
MTRSTHKRTLLALAGLAVAAVIVLALSTFVRATRAIDGGAPPDPSGSGRIGEWAKMDIASHAYDDIHGLASAVGPSTRPPRYARTVDGIVFQMGRILERDTLVASVFEPAQGAGGKVGAFRVAAIDMRTGRPIWRSSPYYSLVVPLRVADGAVTVLAGARHGESESRRLALGVATTKQAVNPLDPLTYVLRWISRGMEEPPGYAGKRVVRLSGAGEARSVDVGVAGVSGAAWSESYFVAAGGSDVSLTSLDTLETRAVTGCLDSAQVAEVCVRPGVVLASWRASAAATTAAQETTAWVSRPATGQATGAVGLGVTAVDPAGAKVMWRSRWGFPAVTLASDGAAAAANDAVVIHISEEATTAPGGEVMAYSATSGKELWPRPVRGPAGQDLFGDRAFSRRRVQDGTVRWLFCTATRPSALATDPAAASGLFVVDLAQGTGRFLSRQALGLTPADAVRVVWSGDELMVLQSGAKPQLLLVSGDGRVKWRVPLPGPLDEKRLGLMADDRWIVAGNLVLER